MVQFEMTPVTSLRANVRGARQIEIAAAGVVLVQIDNRDVHTLVDVLEVDQPLGCHRPIRVDPMRGVANMVVPKAMLNRIRVNRMARVHPRCR